MARTDNLTNYLTDVASAIKTKKDDNTPIQASNFDTEIANLPSDNVSEYFNENMNNGGNLYPATLELLKKIPAIYFNGTNCSKLFSGCKSLTNLDLSNFDTSNVTTMSEMFSNTQSLTSLDLSNFDTSKVTTMNSMFQSCLNLKDLNLSNFDASKVTNVSLMFLNTGNLTNLSFMNNLGQAYRQKTINYSSYSLSLTSENLTSDSLSDLINKLYDLNLSYDVANGGTLYTQKLQLGATNLEKVSEADQILAANKGWTLI